MIKYADIRPYAIAACGLVSAGLSLSVSITAAAEIKSFNLKDDRVEISVSGNIAPGDIDALMASIKAANDAGKLVTSLRLNSEGGNLLEAVRLAAAVKLAKISTNVGQSATCASACFLIFAAGETKYANISAASECMAPPRKVTCLVLLPRRWQTLRRNWMFPGQLFAA